MSKFVGWSRRFVQAIAGVALATTLAACGGGGSGDAGKPVVGGGSGGGSTPSTVADLSVTMDKTSITNAGTDAVTLTVTSIDANRSVVGEVPVKFAIDNGGVITPAGTATDKTAGTLTAKAQIGSDRTNRTINVTVSSGSISKKVSFDVVDSVSGGKVADLAMTVDKTTIANDGSQSAVVTVTTVDANRLAVGGSPVSFKLTDVGDAVISTGGATNTDNSTGKIAATVSLAANHTNRTISVTATSGTVQRTISFDVVDALITKPKASDLTIALDSSNIDNSGSRTVQATVTAVDASRNAISGIPVTFSVDSNAVIAPSGNATNAQGQVTAAVGIGSDRSNRLITVTAKSETLVRTASFVVTGAKLQGTALPTLPSAGSAGNKVEYLLTDVNKNPMIGVPITISAAGLPAASGQTDSNGAYVYSYTAPTTPGAIDVSASAGGASSLVTVTVSAGASTVPPASPTVVSASVSASPNVVKVNSTDTANRTELRALFLGANNAPIKNVRVRFDLNGDVNNIGGTISAGTSIVYSDAGGAATTNYTPSTRSSPTNGVSVRACWDYNDFAAGSCPNQVLTSLTVVSDPLSITIGTDETLAVGDSTLTYVKRYVLLVVDAAGNPKSDVQITPSLDLTGYYKGFYLWDAAASSWKVYYTLDGSATPTAGLAPVCLAEDLNRNGSIDAGEDRNSSNQLEPRKSDASITMVGSTRTDANGTAVLKIEYPKSVAGWVGFTITAAAAGVVSPPASYTGILPVLATALKTESPPPAFVASPYGSNRKSSDLVYCTNKD
ncbi:Ig-like domain-containing protein [Roseateles violae]|uniref:Ig-like domain-containing protein n=1 Tax=Roseateles violae TaxID=3058042 RepID=A0ABT8DS19_9BURK|nr:Ig-like domain-containing protein [Pelomonas sp. PFR6]MDN3921125.1 Ig-like domain-containing protein [Pelomonas sp. PFR6]